METLTDQNWLLTVGTFLPLVGVLVMMFIPRSEEATVKLVGIATAGATLAVGIVTLFAFDYGQSEKLQFFVDAEWIPVINSNYTIGLDGISLPLYILSMAVTFLVMIYTWDNMPDAGNPKAFYMLMLVLQTGMAGTFIAQDLILFFVFFEVVLLPMYFMIGVWGGEQRKYASLKFFLYTMVGSAFMLVSIMATVFIASRNGVGRVTFDLVEIAEHAEFASSTGRWLFFGFAVAFAVKVPVFPLHTWLPDAHTDAPTAVSVMLAGVLLKMGGYGMLRICLNILPDVARDASVWLAVFGVVNILYGAMVTLIQTDLKRLIAYSSISHMGYVLLGVSALGQVGLTGAGMQMFTHGLITGLLFVVVGMVYDRAHTRQIGELSGLAHQMPMIAVVMVIAGLASLGLPSMAGFVSEMMVFLGTFEKHGALTILGVIGILLTAGYILWMIQRVFLGERLPRWEGLGEATAWWERTALVAMVAVIFLIGIYPAVLADVIETGVQPIVGRLA